MKPSVPIIAATLLSFSMAAVPRVARGTLLTTTTACGSTTVVGVVVIIYLIAKKPKPKPDPEDHTRALLDAGMLTVRGDLGTELALLVQSPQAHDQLSTELARGSGPGLDALVRTTGIPPEELARHWQASAEATGLIASSDDAMRFTMDFTVRLAEQLSVQSDVQSALLWQLQRERLDPSFPQSAPAHEWLANWLGVPLKGAVQATEGVLRELDGRSEADQRAKLGTEAERYLAAIARHVSTHHFAEVSAKIDALIAQSEAWLPETIPEEQLAALRGA